MTSNIETKTVSNREVPCFLIGLGAGMALALLFAPSSGAKTRRLISRKARESEDWVKDQAEHLTSTAEVLRDRVEEAARHIGIA